MANKKQAEDKLQQHDKKKPTAKKEAKAVKSKKAKVEDADESEITEKRSSKHTILIITEKPQAALKIAAALSDGKDRKYSDNGVPFYEFERDGKKIIVGCAVGHLFGIGAKKGKKEIPDFNVEWVPAYGQKKTSAFTKKYYMLLKKLAKQADEFIVATDYDIEGEVIGWNVVRFIANQKDAERMKYSSLTKDELNEAFEKRMPHIDWGQAIAGETRHFVDWFYGINLSRALMRSLTKVGRFRIMSIGRVQGPALGIIVDKELEIGNFKSTPYWQVFLNLQDLQNQKVEVKFPKDIVNKAELVKFNHLKGKKGIANTIIKDEQIQPPTPFDLTTLQTEAYKYVGTTPSQTLQLAQKLYLEGLISYPRTSSQKYPEAIGYKKILKQLGKHFSATKYAVNEKPCEGKKSDPAHPAIYPTGEFRKMEGQEGKLFELIVKRFVSTFCDPAVVEEKKIEVEVNGLKFFARGAQIKDKGWMNVYSSGLKEEKVPTMNGEVSVKEIRIEEKMTQPPKRYSEASLVKELESRNLGTKATRAAVIETLYGRGYIKEKSIEATPLGLKLIETLRKYSPIIVDEQLTRNLEEEMEGIQTAEKGLHEKQEKIMGEAKKIITNITKDMRAKEELVGKGLVEANEEMWEQEKQDATLIKCPVCKKGDLRILFNRQYRRHFVGCSAYPECKTTFSLPPNALIKPSKVKSEVEGEKEKLEICPDCKLFPMLLALRKGKRPWKFCFNPNCASRQRQEEARKESDKKEESEEKSEE